MTGCGCGWLAGWLWLTKHLARPASSRVPPSADPLPCRRNWAGRQDPCQYIYPALLALLCSPHTYLATEFLAHKEGVLKETTFIAQRMVGDFAKGLRAFWVVQFLIYFC